MISANRDKTTEDHTIAAETGNECADPASIEGAGASAGVNTESCAAAAAAMIATKKNTAKALIDLNCAIYRERVMCFRERKPRGS